MRYTFGTGDPAAKRLQNIAGIFNPRAREFIKSYCRKECRRAIDLGCGPGYTTEMVADATGAQEVYGLDMAEHFLALAMESYPSYRFIKHDVTSSPFPVKGDIVYSRFLLAHIKEVESVIDLWIEQLNPGGRLFIEEAEEVDTTVSEFNEYLAANEGLVKTQNAELFVGKKLAGLRYNARVLCNERTFLEVTNSQAASLFYPNTITIWEREGYIKNRISPERRREISSFFFNLLETVDRSSDISWRMRRIILERI